MITSRDSTVRVGWTARLSVNIGSQEAETIGAGETGVAQQASRQACQAFAMKRRSSESCLLQSIQISDDRACSPGTAIPGLQQNIGSLEIPVVQAMTIELNK